MAFLVAVTGVLAHRAGVSDGLLFFGLIAIAILQAWAVRRAWKLARWLRKGERPLVLLGAAFAHGTRRALAEGLDGAGGVPAIVVESPRGINDPALGAWADVLARADRIALLGRGVDFCLRFAEAPVVDSRCRFAQVDTDRRAIRRSHRALGKRLRRTLLADPALTAFALAEALRAKPRDSGWPEEVRAAVNHRPQDWEAAAGAPGAGLHPVQVCRAVQDLLDHQRQAVLIADGGEFGQWAQACVRAPQRIINGLSGAIGASLPFAVGARLAAPQATVVAMLGDGTAGFHLLEFDTALRAAAPFVAVIGNDARWNAEHQIQVRDYGPQRLIGCDLRPTRYDRVVEALGGHGEHVEEPGELGPALARAVASGKPACVNVKLDGQAAPVVRR
jgi:acetolactate synthase-1/2/3 large subunit